jgi:hypothetical protein
MYVLLLHLDEQLTNGSPWRATSYTPEDLALLLQFYSLFFETVYIPANLLLDSNIAGSVLELAGIRHDHSAIRSESSPIRILWDTSRFPKGTFDQLLTDLESDPDYVTSREHDVAALTADILDSYFHEKVEYADMTAKLDYRESVTQLREEVFSVRENAALSRLTAARLSQCLDEIEAVGADVHYGRNFYYTVFGYGSTEAQKQLASRFESIATAYAPIKEQFLTAVDYVSHRLKAHFASEATGKRIEVALPKEYARVIFRRSRVDVHTASGPDDEPDNLRIGADYRRPINPERIRMITADEMERLRHSDEFREYRACWLELRSPPMYSGDPTYRVVADNLERALNNYVDRIGEVLESRMQSAARVVALATRAVVAFGGLSFKAVIENRTGTPLDTVDPMIEVLAKRAGDVVEATLSADFEKKWSFHSLDLAEDITIYDREKG